MFVAGYVLGLATLATWLVAEAIYEAAQMKKRKVDDSNVRIHL